MTKSGDFPELRSEHKVAVYGGANNGPVNGDYPLSTENGRYLIQVIDVPDVVVEITKKGKDDGYGRLGRLVMRRLYSTSGAKSRRRIRRSG